jgi:flagellar assembly protein FliH
MDLAKQSLANDKKSLHEMTAHFSDALDRKAVQISEEVLNLSLDISKAMIRAQLQVKPEAILSLIKEVLSKTPIVEKPLKLFLHPHDATIVRTHMQEDLSQSGWTVLDDATIERGGCLVETSANTIDASNQNRWQRICHALGAKNDWLESIS